VFGEISPITAVWLENEPFISLDELVGAGEGRLWNCEAELFRSFEIDHPARTWSAA
jgi:hypothetical protein